MDITELLRAAVARVEAPPAGPDPEPGAEPGAEAHGRLSEVAAWWRRVGRGDAPDRVRHLWAAASAPFAPPTAAQIEVLPAELPAGVEEALRHGMAAADAAADEGIDLLLVSAATPAADAVAAILLQLDPVEAVGLPVPTGVDDEEWIAQVASLRDAMRPLHGVRQATSALLTALGEPLVAAGTGVLLQAAARRTPVVLDGSGAATCALLAHHAAPAAAGWWLAGQGTDRPLHEKALRRLRTPVLTRLGVRTEDGTGARLGLAVLEAATASVRTP